MEIDISAVPNRVMFDSSVLTRTRDQSTDPHAELCRTLWTTLLKGNRRILIPAVALAEFMHHPPHAQPKRHRNVEIVTFDELAAMQLAQLPRHVFLNQSADGGKTTKAVVKFDSMILASALRHKADLLFCMDDRLANLAKTVGLGAMSPLALPHQLTLPGTGNGAAAAQPVSTGTSAAATPAPPSTPAHGGQVPQPAPLK